MGLLESPASARGGPADLGSWSARVVGRPAPGLRGGWTVVLRRGRPLRGRLRVRFANSTRLRRGADLRRRLVEGGVDGLDGLLAGLEGAQRGHHVDHRPRGVDARVLERARARLPGGAAGGRAREEVVAGLARAGDGEDAQAGRRDGPVGADGDRLALLVEHGVAELVGQLPVGRRLERAVAREALALRGADGEEAVAGDGEVERLAGVLERRAAEVGALLYDRRAGPDRADRP